MRTYIDYLLATLPEHNPIRDRLNQALTVFPKNKRKNQDSVRKIKQLLDDIRPNIPAIQHYTQLAPKYIVHLMQQQMMGPAITSQLPSELLVLLTTNILPNPSTFLPQLRRITQQPKKNPEQSDVEKQLSQYWQQDKELIQSSFRSLCRNSDGDPCPKKITQLITQLLFALEYNELGLLELDPLTRDKLAYLFQQLFSVDFTYHQRSGNMISSPKAFRIVDRLACFLDEYPTAINKLVRIFGEHSSPSYVLIGNTIALMLEKPEHSLISHAWWQLLNLTNTTKPKTKLTEQIKQGLLSLITALPDEQLLIKNCLLILQDRALTQHLQEHHTRCFKNLSIIIALLLRYNPSKQAFCHRNTHWLTTERLAPFAPRQHELTYLSELMAQSPFPYMQKQALVISQLRPKPINFYMEAVIWHFMRCPRSQETFNDAKWLVTKMYRNSDATQQQLQLLLLLVTDTEPTTQAWLMHGEYQIALLAYHLISHHCNLQKKGGLFKVKVFNLFKQMDITHNEFIALLTLLDKYKSRPLFGIITIMETMKKLAIFRQPVVRQRLVTPASKVHSEPKQHSQAFFATDELATSSCAMAPPTEHVRGPIVSPNSVTSAGLFSYKARGKFGYTSDIWSNQTSSKQEEINANSGIYFQ